MSNKKRRPAGYREMGNLYRIMRDIETKGGTKFYRYELAVCIASWRGRLELQTYDGRKIAQVSRNDVSCVEKYDYELISWKDTWAHIPRRYKANYECEECKWFWWDPDPSLGGVHCEKGHFKNDTAPPEYPTQVECYNDFDQNPIIGEVDEPIF